MFEVELSVVMWPPEVTETSFRLKNLQFYVVSISKPKQVEPRLLLNVNSKLVPIIYCGHRYRIITGKDQTGHQNILAQPSGRYHLLIS